MFCTDGSWLGNTFTPSHVHSLQKIYLAYANAVSGKPVTLLNQNAFTHTTPKTLMHTHARTKTFTVTFA